MLSCAKQLRSMFTLQPCTRTNDLFFQLIYVHIQPVVFWLCRFHFVTCLICTNCKDRGAHEVMKGTCVCLSISSNVIGDCWRGMWGASLRVLFSSIFENMLHLIIACNRCFSVLQVEWKIKHQYLLVLAGSRQLPPAFTMLLAGGTPASHGPLVKIQEEFKFEES